MFVNVDDDRAMSKNEETTSREKKSFVGSNKCKFLEYTHSFVYE